MARTSIACIALDKGKVLIAHRNPVGQMGGRWEFPGGKVDEGETCAQALLREFREEFGIDIEIGDKVAESSFLHNGENFSLCAYRVFVPHDGMKTPYTLTEHSEYRWADIDEIPALNFVDSDMKIYPFVKEYILSLQS